LDIYAASDAPGFAVSVAKEDTILFQQAFGLADIHKNRSYTNQTTQPIGSISKTFVAAAIVKAIEQGHFTLETDINEILPFQVENPKQPNVVIKVKHLVTHTSGLLDNFETYLQAYHILPGEEISTEGAKLMQNGFGFQQREGKSLGHFLAGYYQREGEDYHPDNFASTPPGASWNYSNIATSLAAYLVETATGTPFNLYVKEHILEPLEMGNTGYGPDDLEPLSPATLYWDQNTPFPKYGNDSYPDGSIHTCNLDLSKFLLDMMKGARGASTKLFSGEGYKQLFQALLPEGVMHESLGENQGIFWIIGNGTIEHDGSDPGTTCYLQFDNNGATGYYLLTNMDASVEDHENAYFKLAARIHNVITEFLEAN